MHHCAWGSSKPKPLPPARCLENTRGQIFFCYCYRSLFGAHSLQSFFEEMAFKNNVQYKPFRLESNLTWLLQVMYHVSFFCCWFFNAEMFNPRINFTDFQPQQNSKYNSSQITDIKSWTSMVFQVDPSGAHRGLLCSQSTRTNWKLLHTQPMWGKGKWENLPQEQMKPLRSLYLFVWFHTILKNIHSFSFSLINKNQTRM